MNEWLMIYLMAVSSSLFAVGGTKGKYWRRYVLPLAIGLPCLYYVELWRIVGYILTLSLALHLGYGSKANWWYRFLAFMGYSLPCLFIGFSGWIIATPILCATAFLLSNNDRFEQMFFWKGVEFFYGLLIAITLIATINGGMR